MKLEFRTLLKNLPDFMHSDVAVLAGVLTTGPNLDAKVSFIDSEKSLSELLSALDKHTNDVMISFRSRNKMGVDPVSAIVSIDQKTLPFHCSCSRI